MFLWYFNTRKNKKKSANNLNCLQDLTNENNDSFGIFRNLGQKLHGSGCSWMALRGQRVERFLGEATEGEKKRQKSLTVVPTNGMWQKNISWDQSCAHSVEMAEYMSDYPTALRGSFWTVQLDEWLFLLNVIVLKSCLTWSHREHYVFLGFFVRLLHQEAFKRKHLQKRTRKLWSTWHSEAEILQLLRTCWIPPAYQWVQALQSERFKVTHWFNAEH